MGNPEERFLCSKLWPKKVPIEILKSAQTECISDRNKKSTQVLLEFISYALRGSQDYSRSQYFAQDPD